MLPRVMLHMIVTALPVNHAPLPTALFEEVRHTMVYLIPFFPYIKHWYLSQSSCI